MICSGLPAQHWRAMIREAMKKLSDRERILMNLVHGLCTSIMDPNFNPHCTAPHRNRVHLDFANLPKRGDLVLGLTGAISEWTVCWYVKKRPAHIGGAVVRTLGSRQLCNYDNENFVPIVGMDPEELYEREQRAIYVKVLRAFNAGDKFNYRFGGLRFRKSTAIVTVRAGIDQGRTSQPFTVSIPFNKCNSVRTILKALRAGGYGTRRFRRKRSQPGTGTDASGAAAGGVPG
jgi:hypothetical protein